MKSFCFTIDDNIRFLKETVENGYKSVFEHPYLRMLLRLHKRFGLKVQLNLFYRMGDFTLSRFDNRYRDELSKSSDWLKFSFHSFFEEPRPYE